MKLRLAVPRRRKRRRRPPEQAPKEIVPAARRDPFDEARERLKREISPPED